MQVKASSAHSSQFYSVHGVLQVYATVSHTYPASHTLPSIKMLIFSCVEHLHGIAFTPESVRQVRMH